MFCSDDLHELPPIPLLCEEGNLPTPRWVPFVKNKKTNEFHPADALFILINATSSSQECVQCRPDSVETGRDPSSRRKSICSGFSQSEVSNSHARRRGQARRASLQIACSARVVIARLVDASRDRIQILADATGSADRRYPNLPTIAAGASDPARRPGRSF